MIGGLIKRGSRWAAAAVTALTVGFGFAGPASAGSFHSESACPDGVPSAKLVIDRNMVAPGTTRVTINGVTVDPEQGMIVTQGGTYVAKWYGPQHNGDGTYDSSIETEWSAPGGVVLQVTINQEACTAVAPTTSTTVAGANTPPPGVALPCPLPIFTPGVGWACPPVPVPSVPFALDLDVSACDQVPAQCAPSTTGATATGDLPATGRNTDLLLLAGALTAAAGVSLLIVRRRHPVAS